MIRMLLLGAPRPLHLNRWKDDIAEGAQHLGWEVNHLPARGPTTDDVIRQAKGCDLFIWARTHGHNPAGDRRAMLRRIEDLGVPTVALHLDLYWGIPSRQAEIGVDPWWTCQWVYTADGGPRDWAGRGVNHRWLPPAMGQRFLGRGQPVDQYRHRAVFVGSMTAVHGGHRRRLIAWASRTWGRGFRRYGTRGAGAGGVWGGELNRLYASAGLVLGDSAPTPGGRYWSDRLPCTLGRGGLLAYPETPGLAELGFTAETMILYRREKFAQITTRLKSLTARQRTAVTSNAIDLIASRHLWRHRLADIAREVLR